MRDLYFLSSLTITLLVYLAVVGSLCLFILMTGLSGFLFILFTVVILIAYFYKGTEKKKDLPERLV